MIITNKYALPEAVVKAVQADEKQQTSDISVTQLIQPPQKVALERRWRDKLEDDASNRVWALLGKAFHNLLESTTEPGVYKEVEYSIHVQDWSVSGRPDHIEVESKHPLDFSQPMDCKVVDYKTASTWGYRLEGPVKQDWEQQLNLYAELIEQADPNLLVTDLSVMVLWKDWNQGEAERQQDYPQTPIASYEVPMWDLEKRYEFLCERVTMHQAAQQAMDCGERMLPCSDEERWLRGEKWAVMKPGRKSAVKLFDNAKEANEFVDSVTGGYVEHRPGVNIRCERYCYAAPFCQQWEEIQNG